MRTPSAGAKHSSYYGWMLAGETLYQAFADTHELFDGQFHVRRPLRIRDISATPSFVA